MTKRLFMSIIYIQMKKIFDFFKTPANATIWTVFYIASVFCILFLIFDFNIFSFSNWNILLTREFKNFSGFVFIILLVSIMPLYIATIYMIIKNKKTTRDLLNISKKKDEEKKEEKKQIADEYESEKKLPEHIPSELKGAFLMATKNRVYIKSGFDNKIDLPENIETESHTLPLPVDFNFESSEHSDSDVPKFTEINFDTLSNESNSSEFENEIIKYLKDKNHNFEITENEIVIYNDMAIISHSDSNFWIPDATHWFANGKQKKSPIESIITIAKDNNVKPAIYLGEKNIMDLENKIPEWESEGIIVINNIEDL